MTTAAARTFRAARFTNSNPPQPEAFLIFMLMSMRHIITAAFLLALTAGFSDSCNSAFAMESQRKAQRKARKTNRQTPTAAPEASTAQAAKPKPPAQKAAQVGPAIKENKATPIDRITVADGFQVELLYSVPGVEQGSWVNLCEDNQGGLFVSDQFGGLYQVKLPEDGGSISKDDVKPVPADIRAVNGMLWFDGALFVSVNDYEQKISSGLYRLTDSDNNGDLDKVELIQAISCRGDHGAHALVKTPDGKSFFWINGNNSKPVPVAKTSPVVPVWGEDHLLPSMPDGRGHNRGVLAPGGIIYKYTPETKTLEAYANGFRNIFDASINKDGELFTYDADMEYDFNTPWYRPTRVCHVTSGSEWGWRNGAGKRPTFYEDNLPPVIDIGPGSPTGTLFGYGARFPAKYQNAFYALDWSWGKLYAVHLEPDGSSYKATKEEFVTGAPLPITDAIIHPKDGAMYFAIGGRRVQSGLYRVSYVGNESTETVSMEPSVSEARETRHMLEAFHGHQKPETVETAWPYLTNSDRFIRFAARTAIEHQPVDQWQDKALSESDPATRVMALLALARVTGTCPLHRSDETPAVDEPLRADILKALASVNPSELNQETRLALYRTVQLVLNRFGEPQPEQRQLLLGQLDPQFPAKTPSENWLLSETLAFLQSSEVAAEAIALMQSVPTQEEQMQYARSIRFLKSGWTQELRTAYLEWFLKASNYRGGASFAKFIEFIRNDAVSSLSEEDKTLLAEVLNRQPEKKTVLENLGAVFEGRDSTDWTLDELATSAETKLANRDYSNGRKMFAAAGCYACHRFGDQGGMTGPDLTSAGRRYSPRDLIDQVINPSKVINEQFSSVIVITEDGKTHTGVVVNLSGDRLTLNTDLADPNKRVNIDRKEIEEMEVSKVSAMPKGLFSKMTEDEVMDLLAYVLSGGDSAHRYFSEAAE